MKKPVCWMLLFLAWSEALSVLAAWQFEAVCPGDTCTMAEGPDQSPVFACLGENNQDLLFLSRAGGIWESEVVANGSWNPASKVRLHLDLDSQGRPGVVHNMPGQTGVFLSRKIGGEWETENVFTETNTDTHYAFAFDGQDNPLVICLRLPGMSYTLHAAWWDGTQWQRGVLHTAYDRNGPTCDLVFDDNGMPHIAFVGADGAAITLYHAWYEQAQWHFSSLPTWELQNGACAINVGPDDVGIVHVRCDDHYFPTEHYTVFSSLQHGGTQVVDTMPGDCHYTYPHVAYDPSGRPGIVYMNHSSHQLKYAQKVNGSWGITEVASLTSERPYPSLLYDSAGRPMIGYCDQGQVWLAVGETAGTPIPTPTPTVTPTATITSTPTATMVQTVTPQPSATAAPRLLGVSLTMPAHGFREGDPCSLSMVIYNHTGDSLGIMPVAVVLDVYGEYWMAPSWRSCEEGLDYYTIQIEVGETSRQIIEPFNWPAGTGTADGIRFYGAIVAFEEAVVTGDIGVWEFGWE
ncbi:hypothetical protein JW905_01660 [bacterium]|nr:hypothetical protein [candidate division CSSED10-310 bacterium]